MLRRFLKGMNAGNFTIHNVARPGFLPLPVNMVEYSMVKVPPRNPKIVNITLKAVCDLEISWSQLFLGHLTICMCGG